MATEVVEEATEKKWWDWVNANGARSSVPDNAPMEAKRAYFDDLVSRCVLVKALSPLVTHQILAVAIDQFATVLAVKFLRNPMTKARPSSSGVVPNHSGMAVVELDTPEKAQGVVAQLRQYFLMVAGMPRPVRAEPAQPLMLVDHPSNRKEITVRFVDFADPEASVLKRRKRKSMQHLEAAEYLREVQQQEEMDLHTKHKEEYKDLSQKHHRLKSNKDISFLREWYGIPHNIYRR